MAEPRQRARQGEQGTAAGADKLATGADQHKNDGWALFSYLIAGMAVYGGIGALVDHWTHAQLYFPIGMLVGLVLAIVLILYRYGRS